MIKSFDVRRIAFFAIFAAHIFGFYFPVAISLAGYYLLGDAMGYCIAVFILSTIALFFWNIFTLMEFPKLHLLSLLSVIAMMAVYFHLASCPQLVR